MCEVMTSSSDIQKLKSFQKVTSRQHKATMAWKSFLLNGFLSMMDMKQQLMMGTNEANCCEGDIYKSSRSLDTHTTVGETVTNTVAKFYTNPVIRHNAPDPGVVRLKDGSGWVAVVTSDHSSRYTSDPRAFPLYYSRDLVNWELRYSRSGQVHV